jgi:predicted Ser/Thr protein kinase
MELEKLINDKYRLSELLGRGSFGAVFKATDETSGKHYAIKVEDTLIRYPQLHHEAKMLSHLEGEKGFTKVYWLG